mmetsp:Transcript_24487/g.62850  ORF Transcript_24487/g.62850 Transcript_24487/m.62850 type:complete len:246 (+) Transcript_24487:892-1629(+)
MLRHLPHLVHLAAEVLQLQLERLLLCLVRVCAQLRLLRRRHRGSQPLLRGADVGQLGGTLGALLQQPRAPRLQCQPLAMNLLLPRRQLFASPRARAALRHRDQLRGLRVPPLRLPLPRRHVGLPLLHLLHPQRQRLRLLLYVALRIRLPRPQPVLLPHDALAVLERRALHVALLAPQPLALRLLALAQLRLPLRVYLLQLLPLLLQRAPVLGRLLQAHRAHLQLPHALHLLAGLPSCFQEALLVL